MICEEIISFFRGIFRGVVHSWFQKVSSIHLLAYTVRCQKKILRFCFSIHKIFWKEVIKARHKNMSDTIIANEKKRKKQKKKISYCINSKAVFHQTHKQDSFLLLFFSHENIIIHFSVKFLTMGQKSVCLKLPTGLGFTSQNLLWVLNFKGSNP